MIVLASNSEWRAKLLTQWGFQFEIRPTNVDEDSEKDTIKDPQSLVKALALKKYQACPRKDKSEIILAADTVIVFNDHVIGKPKDQTEARSIIKSLAGNTHQVWTGVCINGHLLVDKASVTFSPMTNIQIETYLKTNDWVGKAGAYQVQKAIKPFISKIDGDINTIIGLPKLIQQYLVFK